MKAISGLEYFAEVWKGDPVVDKVLAYIAELEAGGTAYDAGYQAAKADMEERVYRAEAALAGREQTIRLLQAVIGVGVGARRSIWRSHRPRRGME